MDGIREVNNPLGGRLVSDGKRKSIARRRDSGHRQGYHLLSLSTKSLITSVWDEDEHISKDSSINPNFPLFFDVFRSPIHA